jgi:TolA-binding protein
MATSCEYGRGTRWALGIMATVVIAAVSVLAAAHQATLEDVVEVRAATAAELQVMRDRVAAQAVTAGRIEERLASLDQRLARMEASLERLAEGPSRGPP